LALLPHTHPLTIIQLTQNHKNEMKFLINNNITNNIMSSISEHISEDIFEPISEPTQKKILKTANKTILSYLNTKLKSKLCDKLYKDYDELSIATIIDFIDEIIIDEYDNHDCINELVVNKKMAFKETTKDIKMLKKKAKCQDKIKRTTNNKTNELVKIAKQTATPPPPPNQPIVYSENYLKKLTVVQLKEIYINITTATDTKSTNKMKKNDLIDAILHNTATDADTDNEEAV